MPRPGHDLDADAQPDPASDGDADTGAPEPGRGDRPALLAATPDANAVFARLRTIAVLVGALTLFVLLVTAELLVRL
ncbi:hypothetical protein ABNG02_07560 [Halorubrum ejinorense]|uniref:AI-2E family transporter n=1 Tax=Halorubrum ejinorense TaxID=425309 RepID=A0AAV3SUP4_9EURY